MDDFMESTDINQSPGSGSGRSCDSVSTRISGCKPQVWGYPRMSLLMSRLLNALSLQAGDVSWSSGLGLKVLVPGRRVQEVFNADPQSPHPTLASG